MRLAHRSALVPLVASFSIALVATGVARAEWMPLGAPVAVVGGNQSTPSVAPDGSGGVFIAWRDQRPTGDGEFVQHLDASGRPLWANDGVLAAVATTGGPPSVCADGYGGAIATWANTVGVSQIFVQRINTAGLAQWGNGGVALTSGTGGSQAPAIIGDGSGGAVIAWDGDPTNIGTTDIYAQRVDSTGNVLWADGGKHACVAPGNQFGVKLASLSPDPVLAWTDWRQGSSNADIYAQHLAINDGFSPYLDGIPVCTQPGDQSAVVIGTLGTTTFLAWQDSRSGTPDIYCQSLQSTLAANWTSDGEVVCNATGSQTAPAIAATFGSRIFVGWEDHRGGVESDLFFQRFNNGGTPQLAPNGVPLCSATGSQSSLVAVPDGTSAAPHGAIFAWRDQRSGAPGDIYAQRAAAIASTPLWATDGVPLCTASGAQQNPAIALTAEGVAMVAWQDGRGADDDIYAQRAASDYLIASSAGPNGTVSPLGTVAVNLNGNSTFTITPAAGYIVDSLLIDGSLVTPDTSYTFTAVASNHTLEVTFRADPIITRIEPDHGGNRGPITVVITGAGFLSGASALLINAPQPDIVASNVVVAGDGLSLSATFDLDGKLAAVWQVAVVNPDEFGGTLDGAFTIESLTPPQLQVSVLGPPQIRASRRYPYDLVIQNSGNVDAVDVPLWLTGVPLDATLELDTPLSYPPQSGGEPAWSGVPLFFTSPGGKYLPLVVPRVPPGSTVLRVYLTVPTTPSFKLRAAVTPPWADGSVFRGCLGNGGISNPACMGAQLTAINAYLSTSPTIEALSGIAVWSKIAWQCEGAGSLPAALTKAEQVLDFMVGPVESPATSLAACSNVLPPRWRDSLLVTIVGAIDPNEKLGSRDSISLQQAIPYSIRFENAPNASAPAQDAVITDPLNVTWLDPATVSLGAITFGSFRITPPPGLSTFSTTVDMRPTRNILVHLNVGLDPISHNLSWSFVSTDPAGQPPPVSDGFLPANVTPPLGEGSVLFTVMPKPSLPSGTTIHNYATIKFDQNAPTQTNDWPNTVDIVPPSSHVLPLSVHSDLPSIPVAWMADGTPPDLRDFTVLVSEDGASFRVWRQNVATTSDTLVPPGDHHLHSYAFYSVSRDIAGNVEATPPGADATTQSRTAVGDAVDLSLALEGARPNPTLGALVVWFTLPSKEFATLDLIDVTGRRVWRRDVGGLGPGAHSVAIDSDVRMRPGLYFVRLAHGSRVLTSRVAVIR